MTGITHLWDGRGCYLWPFVQPGGSMEEVYNFNFDTTG
jgi:hypothetical protein